MPIETENDPGVFPGEGTIRPGQDVPIKRQQTPLEQPADVVTQPPPPAQQPPPQQMPEQQQPLAPQLPASTLGVSTATPSESAGIVPSNLVLQTPLDFRKFGAEVEVIGDYITLAAAEGKGRAVGIHQHNTTAAELAQAHTKDDVALGKSRVDAYGELERLAKKISRQGRKLSWLKDTSMFGHAVRYSPNDPEVAAIAVPPCTTDQLVQANEAHRLAGLTMLHPSFIGVPIDSPQQVLVISQELEALGQLLLVQGERHRTQSELDKRRAVDMHDKSLIDTSKHTAKLCTQYEKYGRKIARFGQEIGAVNVV